MGVSTDGILAFGLDLSNGDEGRSENVPWAAYYEEGDNEGEDMYEDIEDWWLKTQAPELEAEYDALYATSPELTGDDYLNKSGPYSKWRDENEAKINKLLEQRREVLGRLPVEEVMHCSYDYAMYILAPKGYSFSAYRGSPQVIESSDLEVTPVDLKRFNEFLTEYNIKGTPKWYLASMWG